MCDGHFRRMKSGLYILFPIRLKVLLLQALLGGGTEHLLLPEGVVQALLGGRADHLILTEGLVQALLGGGA